MCDRQPFPHSLIKQKRNTHDDKKTSRRRLEAGPIWKSQGRPAGTGEVGKLRAAIAKRVPDLLDAMLAKALDGDVEPPACCWNAPSPR
jgi:hypothetical protein